MSLLDPQNDRSLYTEALATPSGYRFDHGVALTYSLDPDTLLAVPLHLLLYATGDEQDRLLRDEIALLDALRRTTERLTVFHQRGRILEPRAPRVLFGLLEDCVHEAAALGGGSFHPKLWLLRFVPTRGEGRSLLRCLVLSRNLTPDRSWDVSLRLEGEPQSDARPVPANDELAELLQHVPGLTDRGLDGGRRERLAELAAEVARTRWHVPEPYTGVRFHVLGLTPEPWRPPESDRLMIVSPFCTNAALRDLAATTGEPHALVSRPEELLPVDASVRELFEACHVLQDEAERDDGEEEPERWGEHQGLHAKLYLLERGDRTTLFVGSANATHAAVVAGRNVEILVELEGPTEALGGIDAFLSEDRFGGLLFPFDAGDVAAVPEEERAAERKLDGALDHLASLDLSLRCHPEGDRWRLVLETEGRIELPGITGLEAWPITVARDQAVDASPLLGEGRLAFPPVDVASLTRFIAFRLTEATRGMTRTFVLRLLIEGLPAAEREAAVTRQVIRNRDGFLRYLLFLLGELDADDIGSASLGDRWTGGRRRRAEIEALPLLEEMTRAFCHEPGRLDSVRRLIRDLVAAGDGEEGGDAVVPGDFLELWSVFEEAMDGVEAKNGEGRRRAQGPISPEQRRQG